MEAAVGFVELHRGDTQIEGDPHTRLGEVVGQGGESILHQPESAARRQRGGELRGGGIAVEGDHPGPGLQEGAAVAAGAERPVDDPLPKPAAAPRPLPAAERRRGPARSRRGPDPRQALLGPHGGQPLAGDLQLGGALGLEGRRSTNLETVAQADHADAVGEAEFATTRQGHSPGRVERQLAMPPRSRTPARSASGSPTSSSPIRNLVAIKKRTPTAFDAVGFDRGKAEDAIEGSETAARNSTGTTRRRFASSSFSKIEKTPRPTPAV